MEIRPAKPKDLISLMELRNWYVANSEATFDETPFSYATMRAWFAQFGLGPHRLLIAEYEGRMLGYCDSQQYRAHPAFSKTIETSIYVQPESGRSGIGSALYSELFRSLTGQGLHRAVVGIALPNEASIHLHAKFGFQTVGIFNEYACKGGQFSKYPPAKPGALRT